jgi:hypothetical protein
VQSSFERAASGSIPDCFCASSACVLMQGRHVVVVLCAVDRLKWSILHIAKFNSTSRKQLEPQQSSLAPCGR